MNFNFISITINFFTFLFLEPIILGMYFFIKTKIYIKQANNKKSRIFIWHHYKLFIILRFQNAFFYT